LLTGCLPERSGTESLCQDSFSSSPGCLATWFSKLSRCSRRAAAELRQRSRHHVTPGMGSCSRGGRGPLKAPSNPKHPMILRGFCEEPWALQPGPAQASCSSSSEGSSLRCARRSSSPALSHVAGIQAGGALFPLEISDKNPFPPPFPPARQDKGVGLLSRRAHRTGGCGEPPKHPRQTPAAGPRAPLGSGPRRQLGAAGEPRTFPGTEPAPGLCCHHGQCSEER